MPPRSTAAFKQAAHIVALDIVHQRLIVNAMEPRAVMAEWEGDRLIVHIGSQNPQGTRDTLCDVVLKMPQDKVRVVVRDIGGGFGMKVGIQPDEAVAVWAAKVLKRPVKWRAERSEEFAGATAGRDQLHKCALALDKDGKILALRMEAFANVGAYPSRAGVAIPLFVGPKVTTGTYDIPVVDLKITCVLTHTATIGAYRGAGRPECLLDLERLVDTAARQIGMDPAELRRRNFVTPAQMPYTSAMGETVRYGRFQPLPHQDAGGRRLERLRRAQGRSREARQALRPRARLLRRMDRRHGHERDGSLRGEGRRQGRDLDGHAGHGPGAARPASPSSRRSCSASTPSQIEIAMGDSDRVGGVGSMGSRSAYIGGSAVLSGSEKLVDKGKELAADALEASAADIGYARAASPSPAPTAASGWASWPPGSPTSASSSRTSIRSTGIAWPNGAHVGEVEIDPDTGLVELKRYTTVDDVGRPLHRPIVFGQIQGGCAQGIGQALLEENVYDRETGQLITGSFMDYAMPRADDLPDLLQRARRQRAGQDQSARRQGRRRIGHGRLDAHGDERDHGCAVAARRAQCADAGDAAAGVAGHPGSHGS